MHIKDKRKILYVITKSNWGGAQRYVFDLAVSLPKEQFEVAVALGGKGPLKKKLEKEKIKTFTLPIKNDFGLGNAVGSIRYLTTLLKEQNPDVLHINSTKAGIVAGIAGRITRTKTIIFTAHGWAFLEDRTLLIRFLLLLTQWVTVLLAHKVISVSEYIKKTAPILLANRSEKVTIIKNGITAPKYIEREKAQILLLGKRAALFKDRIWIGTISELHPNKGLIYTIKATKEIPNIVFVVMGEGREYSRLENYIQEKKLTDTVFLVGHKDNATTLLKAFDIFTLTSTTEALSYALLEAGAAGLPIIASSVGGIPEVVENNKSGLLVPPQNSIAIESALKKLIREPTLRIQLGSAAQQHSKECFGKDRMVSETATLYLSLK